MRNAIGILNVLSQGESDIKNGKIKSQEELFNEIKSSLKGKLE